MSPELLVRKKAETLIDTSYEGRWRSLQRAASNALTETSREWLPTLATMSLLTDDPKWAAKATQTLTAIVGSGLSLITPDRGKPVGQETFQLALAYDFMHDRISPPLVAGVQATLRAWGNWVWPETNPARAGAWGVENPADNYFWEFVRATWLAGLALDDAALIALSRQKWQKGLTWLQEHEPAGVFAEGSNYGIGSLVSILQALCSNFTATGEAVPDWCRGALWAMFEMTSPGMGAKTPWGDQASSYPAVQSDTDRFAALMMATFGSLPGPARYWLDNIARNRSKRAQSFWFEFMMYPSHIPPVTYQNPDAIVYADSGTGYVSTRSGWEKDAIQVQVMCGPTFSTHQDACGTFVVCRGNDWLIGHAKQWSASGLQHGAEFVNCISVDGRGQDNMLDKTAYVLQSVDKAGYTLWQIEGGQAYDYSLSSSNRIHPLKSWRRTLMYVKPDILFVHDRVEKAKATSSVVWNLNHHQTIVPGENGWITIKEGASEARVTQMIPNAPISLTPLALGPAAAVSSWKTSLAPPPGQLVDEFLVVFQFGPAGFTPLPVTKTALGAMVGDDEFTITPEGVVALVDHRVSPRDLALGDLLDASEDWLEAYEEQKPDEEEKVQAVVEAAQRLLSVVHQSEGG